MWPSDHERVPICNSFFQRDWLTGITLSRPIRTSPKSRNSALALTSANVTGRGNRYRGSKSTTTSLWSFPFGSG